ncbi:MAG TPA: tryptophan 2,3-dioxygenase family protein [Kofleriaceae bacterium]|jgi:tryptophan 2,3-dioxygenase|nr:tryptophan 2,3-dioxygenase family protein [Kofleriaceae bacterium]
MPLTDYEKYIRTEELLRLQKPAAELSTHDELQFQIVHQVAELWMKLVDHELHEAVDHLDHDRTCRATHILGRVARIMRLLVQQLDLLDTMAPNDYMTIRTGLGRGSGQESPGFKTLLRLPGELVWPAVRAFIDRRGVPLLTIYQDPHAHPELYQVCEALIDYDQLLQIWRQRHLMLVYRVIGAGTPSLKGKPSDLLAHGLKQRFFPELWAVRDQVFEEWTQSMKGDPGYHG